MPKMIEKVEEIVRRYAADHNVKIKEAPIPDEWIGGTGYIDKMKVEDFNRASIWIGKDKHGRGVVAVCAQKIIMSKLRTRVGAWFERYSNYDKDVVVSGGGLRLTNSALSAETEIYDAIDQMIIG